MPQARVSADETPRDKNLTRPKPAGVPGSIDEHELEVVHGDEHGHIESFELIRIAVAAILAGMVWFRSWEPFPQVSLIGIAGVLFGGWPIE